MGCIHRIQKRTYCPDSRNHKSLVGVWIGTQHQELIEFLIIDKVQEKYLSIACFIILFFGIIILGAIIIKISEKFINFIQLKLLNKIAGVALGIVKILSFLIVIVFIIESWDVNSLIIKRDTKEASIAYPIFKKYWKYGSTNSER